MPNAVEDAEQTEHSFITCGNTKCRTILGDSLVVSHKIKHILTIRSTHHVLGVYPKELKIFSHKNLHMDIYSNFVHNATWKATKMSF